MLDVKKIRNDFPMLDNKVMQGHPLVYFDSAATSLKPKCVIEAMTDALGKGDSIYLRGFATFKARMRKAKPAQNINKKETIMLPPRRDVKLVLGKEILRRLNG